MRTTPVTFFCFDLADNMFPAMTIVSRLELSPAEAKVVIEAGVSVCLNHSHSLTIAAMNNRFGISCIIPERAGIIALQPGDSLLVMGVVGLPRLEGRHEYTEEEVANAKFRFGLWTLDQEHDGAWAM